MTHTPVLLAPAVAGLNLPASHYVVDATYGRGGHTRAVVAQLPPRAKLLLIDRDAEAIAHATTHYGDDPRVSIVHAPFSRLAAILMANHWFGQVSAILFDFGVSTPQLAEAERGFSFTRDGPLDMRMDRDQPHTAATWLEQVKEAELVRVLKVYGEEKFARRIARKIKQTLLQQPITTTGELSRLVGEAMPRKPLNKHHATRTFQAIRIAINDELAEIDQVLPQALAALAVGGRLVVISFHSLEDRLVKRFLRVQAKGDDYPPDLPVTYDQLKPRLRPLPRPRRPTAAEIAENPRARSAVLRLAEKLDTNRDATMDAKMDSC